MLQVVVGLRFDLCLHLHNEPYGLLVKTESKRNDAAFKLGPTAWQQSCCLV